MKRYCAQPDCNARLSKENKTGYCGDHVTDFLHPNLKRCEVCHRVIQQTCKGNLCADHRWPDRQRAEVNENVLTLARDIGAAVGVHHRDILGLSRLPLHVEARALVVRALRKQGLSYPRIGRRIGRDHSTVIFLDRNVEAYAARNPKVAAWLEVAA